MPEQRPSPPSPSTRTMSLTVADLAIAPPPQIPDHELLRRVGEGAYGEVWLARNVMGTYRAVKIVYRRSFSDDRPYEREFAGIKNFEPISRAHGSQVDILHVGRNDTEGYFYYVMELADDAALDSGSSMPDSGCPASSIPHPEAYVPKTLKLDLTRRGRLPFDECLDLSLALTTALENLHQNGLMHRDIKPANIIFINRQPKLADIGLVADVDATKSFVGTEGYIPPEGPTSPQADIYSLGKVLYEAATGRDRMDFPELPTNLSVATDIAGLSELNEIILKACASELRHRYQNAEEMHADLLILKTGKSVRNTRRLEKRLVLLTRIGAAAAVVAALALAAFFYQKDLARRAFEVMQKEQRLREEADTERRRALAAEKAAAEKSRLAEGQRKRADEESLAARQNLYAADMNLAGLALREKNLALALELLNKHRPKSGMADLRGWEWRYLRGLCQNDELYTLATQCKGIRGITISPNGHLLAAPGASPADLRIWDLDARKLILTVNGKGATGSIASSADGAVLAFGTINEGVRLWNVPMRCEIGRFPADEHSFSHLGIALAPDGRILAANGEDGTIVLWDLERKTAIRRLKGHSNGASCLAFL